MAPISKISHFLCLCLLMATIIGCSNDKVTNPHRLETKDGPATLSKRIERTNEFAFNLYHELKCSDDNLVFSPHSISTCFGMAYAGARGSTEREIAEVLYFNYPQSGFHSVLKQLNDLLVSRQELTLNIANGCWGQKDSVFTYIQSYLDTLSVNYEADIEYLDFANKPDESRDIINQWISDHTGGLIRDLIPPEIDAETQLVLANTVYFVAEWLRKFDPDYTCEKPFKRLDGTEITALIMNGEEHMPYYQANDYKAMELPYKGKQISMVLILPNENQYKSFEDNFNLAIFDSVVSNLKTEDIGFSVPIFCFGSGFNLNATLQNLGMKGAFSPGAANFSGVDGTDDGSPWIGWVAHDAYISVTEYGTMAAAGTGMELTVGVHDWFDALRPFIFIIRDIPTGTILFMGRVLDPTVTPQCICRIY